MNKKAAFALSEKCTDIAIQFSRTDREKNYNNETFSVKSIEVLSDTTAVCYLVKEPGNKIAATFLYWINQGGGRWNYFFPTDSHVIGMVNFKDKLLAVERHNFPLNWMETE